jgi:GNAT superfamily N-acetyltransferase
MGLIIRSAGPDDAGTLLGLINALADYEQLPRPDAEARRRMFNHAFGDKPYFRALLVEVDGKPAGYAIYFFTYSTFLMRPTLYLEDVFVLPEARRYGCGSALMRHLSRIALDEGCGRFDWQVLDWNQLARGFYEKLGAQHIAEWLPYRLTLEDIQRLAQEEGEIGA